MPTYFSHLIIIIIGLSLGSFASVVIHRLHTRQKGILWGRSKCPRCETVLRTLDLIPVVSFVINKFQCHFCKKPIAAFYPLLELVMGTAFWLTAVCIGRSNMPLLIFHLFIAFILVTVSFYDMLYREIPDTIMLPAIVISLIAMPLLKMHPAINMLAGALVGLFFFGALFLGSRGRWLGGGDIRLGVLMGILLGWPNVLVGLFLAYLSGSVFSIGGLLLKKLHRKSAIPFGPFLALGLYVALFWGDRLLAWYWGKY